LLLLLSLVLYQVVYCEDRVQVIDVQEIYDLYDTSLSTTGMQWLWTSIAAIFVIALFGSIFYFNRFMQHELTEYAILQPQAAAENKDASKMSKRETKREETKETAKEVPPTSNA
ncbi:hypothetical protein PMAYCL1PPCAC_07742, partial [Pristionchus mayeri]